MGPYVWGTFVTLVHSREPLRGTNFRGARLSPLSLGFSVYRVEVFESRALCVFGTIVQFPTVKSHTVGSRDLWWKNFFRP